MPFDKLMANGLEVEMFKKILIANRGDSGLQAAAAKPNRFLRVAQAGDVPTESTYV